MQRNRYEPRHGKTNKMTVRPVKTQISLGICTVWSESLLSAWRKLGSLATHWANSQDSDQTGRMPRLIWVFAGCMFILLVLSWGGSDRWASDANWRIVFHSSPYVLGIHLIRLSEALLMSTGNIIEPPHDKTNKMTCAPTQSDQTESSLCTHWVGKDSRFLHVDSEDFYQNKRMPRLIWVFTGRTVNFVGFVMMRLICFDRETWKIIPKFS